MEAQLLNIDLSKFRDDGNREWYNEELKRVGEKRLETMYNVLYELAYNLEVGEWIDLVRICRNPENYRIIVKIGCEIISLYAFGYANRLQHLQETKPDATLADKLRLEGRQFVFNGTYTKLRRIN